MKNATIEFEISPEQIEFLEEYRKDKINHSLDSIEFYEYEYIPEGINKESMIRFHENEINIFKNSSYSDLVQSILISKEYDLKK